MDSLQAAADVAKVEIGHIDEELSHLIAAGQSNSARASSLGDQRARLVRALREAQRQMREIKSEELRKKLTGLGG